MFYFVTMTLVQSHFGTQPSRFMVWLLWSDQCFSIYKHPTITTTTTTTLPKILTRKWYFVLRCYRFCFKKWWSITIFAEIYEVFERLVENLKALNKWKFLEMRMFRAKLMWRIDSQFSFLLCDLNIAFRFKVVMKSR